MDNRIENLHVISEDPLIRPDQVKTMYPLTPEGIDTVMRGQQEIRDILDGKDQRLFVVVGPCSIHNTDLAMDYAKRLKQLADELKDSLCIVMRVYFEKPRTSIGWQGLINDPDMDGSCDIAKGLLMSRKLLLEIAELGLPAAGEALDLITPQYVQDLFSWTAIGARTTESQTHRKMASGFSAPVGFKNGTNGDYDVAVNAIICAAHKNDFVSIDPQGQVAVIRTKGNPYSHMVLRGGSGGPNYDAKHVEACERQLKHAGLPVNIMVDCSHANAHKDHQKQLLVLDDIAQQIADGNQSIKGVMIESNINAGNQSIPTDCTQLEYGVSVTDKCIDWQTTETALRNLARKISTPA